MLNASKDIHSCPITDENLLPKHTCVRHDTLPMDLIQDTMALHCTTVDPLRQPTVAVSCDAENVYGTVRVLTLGFGEFPQVEPIKAMRDAWSVLPCARLARTACVEDAVVTHSQAMPIEYRSKLPTRYRPPQRKDGGACTPKYLETGSWSKGSNAAASLLGCVPNHRFRMRMRSPRGRTVE